ncbi:MAG: methyl-accepting chemotaxis protein [Lachnospiraceae bacterium]|nr:methyl-accepting chemotaxis protein [Lachnospiraceae bacterium]
MVENGVLRENEKLANIKVAKLMCITFGFFVLVYILNVLGIFIVDMTVMTIAFVAGAICLLFPTLLVIVLKQQGWWVKYVNIATAVVFVTISAVTLTFHVVVLYVYAIALAGLYFSKRLNIFATILTVIGVSAGQILAFVLETTQDDNFTDWKRVIVFGVIPRALVLIAVAAIFTMLSDRTATLLSNVMGAEEQKNMLNQMQNMRESAANTSSTMVGMVSNLSDITDTTLNANQRIADEADNLLQSSTENSEAVARVDAGMQDIISLMDKLSDMNHRTAELAQRVGENTQDNQKLMTESAKNMEDIYNSTNKCKEIITQLGEESKEILGIITTITSISSQTNILALNASIEAARAGEHGRGFAVVAEEIQKLAEQTRTAVEGIGTIVHQVVSNTERAVSAMEINANLTQSGMENINRANDSTVLVSASNEEMVEQILSIKDAAEVIAQKSNLIAENMKQIRDNTQQNCGAVEQVTSASKANREAANSLAGIVKQIEGLSEQLNRVVRL